MADDLIQKLAREAKEKYDAKREEDKRFNTEQQLKNTLFPLFFRQVVGYCAREIV